MASDSGISKIARAGLLSFAFTCLVIVIAFSTNAWLETDGTLENPKFIQLGGLFTLDRNRALSLTTPFLIKRIASLHLML